MQSGMYNLYYSSLFCVADTWIAAIKVTFEAFEVIKVTSGISNDSLYFLFCSILNLQKSSSKFSWSFHQPLAPTYTRTSYPASLEYPQEINSYRKTGWRTPTDISDMPGICSSGWWCCFTQGILCPIPTELLRGSSLEPSSPRDTLPWPSAVMESLPRGAEGQGRQAQSGSGARPCRERCGRGLFPGAEQQMALSAVPCAERAPGGTATHTQPCPSPVPSTARHCRQPARDAHPQRKIFISSLCSHTASQPHFPGLGSNHPAQLLPGGGCTSHGWPALLLHPWQAVGGHRWRGIIFPYQNGMLTRRRSKAEGSARKKKQ